MPLNRHPQKAKHSGPAPRVRHGRWIVVGLGVALAVGLAACSSGTTKGATTTPPTSSPSSLITIKNFAFSPDSITVRPGSTITVTNKDSVTHTLTSTAGAFTTGDLAGGDTMHFTAPMKAGKYPYRCNIHQYMTGTIVVS